MTKRVKITLETVTDDTPLRLEDAARLGYPDGSMSVDALRRLVAAGKLTVEVVAGKHFTTLALIGEMRKECRVKAKAPTSPLTNEIIGSSETASENVALDALRATVQEQIENLQTTSSKNKSKRTIPLKPSTKVIPMRRK